MKILMDRYEKELNHPVLNLLHGKLLRCILIQVQKVEVDLVKAQQLLNQLLQETHLTENFCLL